jgi:hypothetical protein
MSIKFYCAAIMGVVTQVRLRGRVGTLQRENSKKKLFGRRSRSIGTENLCLEGASKHEAAHPGRTGGEGTLCARTSAAKTAGATKARVCKREEGFSPVRFLASF